MKCRRLHRQIRQQRDRVEDASCEPEVLGGFVCEEQGAMYVGLTLMDGASRAS